MNYIERSGFHITSKDGTKIYVQSFIPNSIINSQIICLPGIGNYGWYFEPLSLQLNKYGIAVYAIDYRGTGLSEGLRWDIPSYRIWIQDIIEVIEHLRDSHLPTFLLGHSLGGALAIHAAPKAQELLKGLIVVAPAMTVKTASLPWTNYLLFPICLAFAPQYPLIKLPIPSYEEMISNHADKPLARQLQKDPYVLKKISARCGMSINYIRKMKNIQSAAENTTLSTFVVCGQDDSAIEGAAQYLNDLASADKRLLSLPSQHHHLLRFCYDNSIHKEIVNWINNRI